MPGERAEGGRGPVWALIALLAAFAAVVSWQALGGSATPAVPTSNPTGRRTAGAADKAAPPPPDVRLDDARAEAARAGRRGAQPVPVRGAGGRAAAGRAAGRAETGARGAGAAARRPGRGWRRSR